MIIRSTRPKLALDRSPAVSGMAYMPLALDRASVRSKDRDGRLHIAVTNISKASVDPYYGEEIPGGEKLGLEPKKIYQLLRDPGELEAAANTFNNLPILSEHIPVSAEAPQKEMTVGSTGTDAVFVSPYLQNSAVIWDQEAIDDIEDEIKKEWSCGYYYTADMTPGNFGGLRYDGVMRNIVGNHVALVDAGRAGPDVVVGDRMPRGLSMKGFKTRTALMLNGALAAVIAPKLAQDKALDLSKALGGVTSKSLGKNADKIAAAVVKAAKPVLAQDAELDADDVVKVISALNGGTPELSEDEDEIAEGSDPKPAVDADDDMLAKVMAFVKGKLSDEDMAELGAMCGQAGDADPEPDGGDGDEDDGKKNKDMPAMDRKAVGRLLADIRTAEREVAPLIGEVKIACDSAAAVYKLALDHAKVDTRGVHPSAYRSMVAMLAKGGDKPASSPIALDRAGASSDFAARFPGAGKLVSI